MIFLQLCIIENDIDVLIDFVIEYMIFIFIGIFYWWIISEIDMIFNYLV